MLLLLLVPNTQALATALPSNITESTTLTKAGSPYTGTPTIEAGVVVSVEPGVRFNLSKLTVKGTLKAEGTPEEPIVFTGAKELTTGEWKGIVFEPGSGASVLDHAEVKYGGEKLLFNPEIGAVEVNASSPTITNSSFVGNKGYGIRMSSGGSPEIADNALFNNGAAAISYTSNTGDSGEINIHDNFVEGGPYGIGAWVFGSASVSAKTLSGNTVIGTEGIGLNYSGPEVPGNITENTLIGNQSNFIQISGTVAKSSTWKDGGTPVKVESGLTVAAAATLSIGPGVYLMKPNLTVKGTLKAEGTAEEPIVFTGLAQTTPGEWGNVKFEAGSGASVLDHVEVKYGGSGTNVGAVEVNASAPRISNSVFRNNKSKGVYVPTGGSPEIAGNYFYENGAYAIHYAANTGHSGEINIHDNFVEKGGGGILARVLNSAAVTGTTLSDNTIVGTSGDGVDYIGSDIPGDITDNTLSGNAFDRIAVSGTVGHTSTWTDSGSPVWSSQELVVASGVTLSIKPGVFLSPRKLTVKGTLKAEGTTEEPVIFTGTKELAAGEWKGIVFEPGSGGSVLDYAEIAFGGEGTASSIEVKGSGPSITNSTIRKSGNFAIKVTESGAPKIERNRFRGNSSGLTYSGSGKLAARNNDWGCASGPSPSGCGDSVNSSVEWKPAVQLPELAGHCRGGESQCGEGADPVSLATGALSYSHRDLLLTNKGQMPLEFTRSYSSGSAVDTGLGPGWSQAGLASASELASGAVLVQRQDGRQDLFAKTEPGYKAPSGVTSSLAKVEGTFQLTTLERAVYRFDSSGRIASVTDDHGLKTTYGYNANGRLATITDPSAQSLTFSYNASNHITLVKDSTGREVKYAYSAAGDLASVTDALGGVTEYTYDSAHRLKTIKDPRGNVILKNTYDGQGRVVEQRDGLENLWTLSYKEDETIVTEPEGGELTYGFDNQDRVVSEEDQLGHTTTTSYDAAGSVDEIVEPGGAKWVFGHDAAGNLTSVVDPEEGERSYEYDGLDRLTSFTDERGETWSYEWDEGNDLVKVTDPAEGETTFTHDASGLPLSLTDANEHTTAFTYDGRGNRLTAKDAIELTTAYAYNTRNQLTSKTEPGLKAETYGRNALGDLLSVTTPEGNKTEYTYDANGMPTQVKDPAANLWKIERDAMERPTAYVDPLERKTEIDYDGNLRPTSVTDRRGDETTYAYDLANQVTEILKPEGGDWEFGYDVRGNRTEVVEPRENATSYEFDLLDRMTAVEEPLESETSYAYDPAGNLTSFTDPRENTTELDYDELGRLTRIDQPLEKTTAFAYDGVGNRLTRTTAAGTLEYGYDAANRLEEISEGASVLRAFDYDPAGRLIGATDAQADEIEVGYDDDGRLLSIDDGRGQTVSREYDSRGNVIGQTDGRGALEYEFDELSQMTGLTDPQGKTLGFDYDAEGNLTKVELPNGVVTTNEYDDAERLAETTSAKGEATLESLAYEYDPAGNRIAQVDRLSQETTYEYDALHRLTEFDPPGEGSTAYGYDPAGNRTKAGATTYSFNDLNQLTSASDGTTYDYDAAGRMIEVDSGETGTTYAWNPLDELMSVDTGAQEIDYTYDALGRQTSRDDGSAIRLTHYGDLSDIPILDTDAEGEPTMSYVQGPAGLVEQRTGEAMSFPLRDAHGDITTLANGEGEVASRQTYDPWGEQLSGPSLEMGWLGAQQRRADPAVELVQMGARPYSSSIGSFSAEDPVLGHVGISVTANRYPYAWDNPLNLYDLDGRDVCAPTPWGGACAGDAGEETWDATAGPRDFVGVAGDGNGGWLSEAPGFAGDRGRDFKKAGTGAMECTREVLPPWDFESSPCSAFWDGFVEGLEEAKETIEEVQEPDDPGDPPGPFPLPIPIPGFTPVPER